MQTPSRLHDWAGVVALCLSLGSMAFAPAADSSPVVNLSRSDVRFGFTPQFITSPVQPVFVTNTGDSPLVISGLTIAGTHASDWFVAGTCTPPISLNPNERCRVDVVIALGSPATGRNATLTIQTNAVQSSSVVTLSASPNPDPILIFVPTPEWIDFAPQAVGTPSPPLSLVVTNTWDFTFDIRQIHLVGGNVDDFALTSDCAVGQGFAPHQSCTFNVVFTPKADGPRSTELETQVHLDLTSSTARYSITGVGGTATPTYPLTVTKAGTGSGVVAGAGIDCGEVCTKAYASGTPVTLTAVPAAGSTFAGWGGACTNNSGPCTVSITAATSVTATFTDSSASSPNYGGMWWNAPAGSEAGWGINFAHQGDTLFATWFTFGLDGKPLWLVVAAIKSAPNVYSGALYTGTGPAFNSIPFDPAKVIATQVGTASFTFIGNNDATFSYSVNGIAQTKNITREVFASPVPSCTWGAQPNLALATNFQDMWWAAPAGAESGWGINFAQQGDTIFATWFTFGVDGKPLWLVVAATKTAPNVYSGTLYTGTGPAFNSIPFDPTKVAASQAGTTTITFTDGNNATFAYTVNGISQTKQITREVFAGPGTVCQ